MPLPARTLTVAIAATLLALAAPLSASAASAPYSPNKPDTWDRTIVPQTFVSHSAPSGTFDPGAKLQISVTGESSAPSFGAFTASQIAGSLTSSADGSALVKLDFGASTRGVYDVTVTEAGTDNYSYGVVTVIPSTTVAASITHNDGVLARTGTNIEVGVLWGAGAAVAASVLLWIVARIRRRAQSH